MFSSELQKVLDNSISIKEYVRSHRLHSSLDMLLISSSLDESLELNENSKNEFIRQCADISQTCTNVTNSIL